MRIETTGQSAALDATGAVFYSLLVTENFYVLFTIII